MDNKETQSNQNKTKPKLATSATLILVAVVAIVGVFLYLYLTNLNLTGNSGDKVVATVNNVDILKREVDEVTSVSKEPPKAVLDKLIKTQILGQYLTKAGFTVSADEIEQNIKKANKESNPSSKLDSKLDLIGRKIKAYYTLDNQGLDKKYSELKTAAKITIHVQL